MGVLGTPEVAALVCDHKRKTVYGVRLRKQKRGLEVYKYASAEHSDWQNAANTVLKELAVNNSVYAVLGLNLEQSEVFECMLPAASSEVMREALKFEVPRQLLSVPESFRLQYAVLNHDTDNGMNKVRCAVLPENAMLKLFGELAAMRNKPDAVVHPLLALPEMSGPVMFREISENLYWQDGCWLTMEPGIEVNAQLDEFLKKHCLLPENTESFLSEYRGALLLAIFAVQSIFADKSVLAAVNVLPDFLRPARYRTQLRLMALLAVLLIAVNVFRYAGGFISEYREYRKLVASVKNTRNKVQDLRKKVKKGEKILKEHQRTAELKFGSRECLGYLGYLSEKLPDDVSLSNFRWNEGIMDINLQTTSPDLDLVSFCNRLPGVKVLSASQRTNPNNFTNANVKLSTQLEKKQSSKAAKAKKKAGK